MKKAKDVKTISLKFPSFIYLTAFRRYSKADYWDINIPELTVVCNCSEKEAHHACQDFRAVLLNVNEEVVISSNADWELGAPQLAFSYLSR
jgi:hypothetical protein